MANGTYYVALPFIRADDGTLTPEQAVECQSGEQAMRRARAMLGKFPGAVAFSRAGDPELGDFQPANILGRFGETPHDLSEL
jgi:hypothetical protein